MTNKELQKFLANLPPDAEIEIRAEGFVMPLHSDDIEMDQNVIYFCFSFI